MMWMFLFMILPLLVIVYVGWHVWLLLPLSRLWRVVIITLGVLCFLTLFLSLNRRIDVLPLSLGQALYDTGTSSLIVLLYLFMLFFVLDLGRLCRLVPRSWLVANWHSAVIIFLCLFGLFLYGRLHYHNKVRVPLELKSSKRLPRTYRVVMASDLHLGYHNPRRELARWVDLFNAEHPDFILIAGDIIDGSMRPLQEERMAEEFRRLQAPVYACLGNHEYFAGSPSARQFYHDAGIHLLIDDTIVIDSSIVIIGRDDRMNRHRKPLKDLIPSNSSHYTILLDHQPYDLDHTEQADIDFQLSGHTHRGQVWPISWITDHLYECSWGSHQRGNTQYYVTSGLGLWGGKFRIGTQSEYVIATIQ